MKAFQDAINALRVPGSVTMVTQSDFGRAPKPAGNIGAFANTNMGFMA